MAEGNAEIRRIEDQLRRAFEGEAWHGPSLQELLHDVATRQALWRPIPHAHTIWEIVLHVSAWENAARRRLEGEPVDLSGDDDWPPVRETTDAAWSEAVAALGDSNRRLRAAVGLLQDEDLRRQTAGPQPQSFYFLLHGVIQHDLYHAGQIAVLKKAAV